MKHKYQVYRKLKHTRRNALNTSFSVLLSLSISLLAAQVNLTPLNLTTINSTFDRGNFLDITFDIQNTGLAASPTSHVGVYLSPTNNFNNAVLIGQLSCEPIAPGTTKSNVPFFHPIPYNTNPGQKYIFIKADHLTEVSESNELDNVLVSNPITISTNIVSLTKTPYPYIFVHGFAGTSATWDSVSSALKNELGWSFGGYLNACLNQDGNKSTSNLQTDYKDWTNDTNLVPADFYVINFNVSTTGASLNNNSSASYNLQSNQAGIVKQGLGVRDAIKHVLQVTGKDKVILVGHSMGGLASREYLQNPSIWQADGRHHVAKLHTTATPHNGSNASLSFLSSLGDVDEASESVRDLRISYYYSNAPGVYLHGGREANSVMDDSFWFNFYNVDVNCNGVPGDTIIGLNQKNIPLDLSYSCVIGMDGEYLISGDQEDGIVDSASANLNRQYPSPFYADTILASSPDDAPTLSFWHTMLALEKELNIRGMDESNNINLPYKVDFNKHYHGLVTKQSMGSSSAPFDHDYYELTLGLYEALGIHVLNIPVSDFEVSLYNSSLSPILSMTSNGKNKLDTSVSNLASGRYILKITGLPEEESWKHPYDFRLTKTSTVSINEYNSNTVNWCSNFPNPFEESTTISFNLAEREQVQLDVFNSFGQLVGTLINNELGAGKHEVVLDGSKLSAGIYFYKFNTKNHTETHKIILQ